MKQCFSEPLTFKASFYKQLNLLSEENALNPLTRLPKVKRQTWTLTSRKNKVGYRK